MFSFDLLQRSITECFASERGEFHQNQLPVVVVVVVAGCCLLSSLLVVLFVVPVGRVIGYTANEIYIFQVQTGYRLQTEGKSLTTYMHVSKSLAKR